VNETLGPERVAELHAVLERSLESLKSRAHGVAAIEKRT
jgi:hypothetical protein